MSGRVDLYRQFLETPGDMVIQRGRFSEIAESTQAARIEYEEACNAKQLYDLVTHFRVAIFGSARIPANSKEFKFVTKLVESLIAARRIDIVTGGGPGIMEAANYGVICARAAAEKNGKQHKAESVGVRIDLPFEDMPNPHLRKETKHENFGTRLHAFISQIKAAYIAQGGVGSDLELLYLMQLKQVKHLEASFPIIAHPFWKPIVEVMHESFYSKRKAENLTPTISEKDLELVQFSDDIEEIVEIITQQFDLWKEIRQRVRFVTNEG
jgi:hypothetical protein